MPSEILRDKVIVVIGGTSGMGLSGARAIVDAGGRVVCVGLDPDGPAEAQQVLAERGRVMTGDARLAGAAEAAIARAVAEFGRFDGLYHVAGGSGRRVGDGALHEASEEGWDYTISLNLKSVFLSNRAAVRQFIRQKHEPGRPAGGAVLNMGSVLADSPSPEFFGTIAYAAAKCGIVGMTRAAAARYAPENIRFNVVAPGLVDTPMARRALGDERIMAYARAKQPLDGGRIGRPEDLDAAVVYLLSDQARFVTGQVLAVDGGWGVSEK